MSSGFLENADTFAMVEDAPAEFRGNGLRCVALIAVLSIGLWAGIAGIVAALV
jgi:hypothetical protein